MNLKDAISAISAEANIPAKQVRTVAVALLKKLADAVESGEEFKSPHVTVKIREVPERTVTGGDGKEKVVPEHRVGIMRLPKAKATEPSA